MKRAEVTKLARAASNASARVIRAEVALRIANADHAAAKARLDDALRAFVSRPVLFDVFLLDRGSDIIQAIKALRNATSLGLKESKDIVDAAPTTAVRSVDNDTATRIVRCMAEAGAKCEIRGLA